MTRDKVYSEPKDMLVDFAFDESVVEVFPDMIRRSVPGYESIISMLGLLAAEHVQSGTRCYDLGCSLGAATVSMLRRIKAPDIQIIAVDNAEAMIAKCRQNIARENSPVPVDILCGDILNVEIQDASVVILNFTLQFIEPGQRLQLITQIQQGLRPGGVLLLSEKVVFSNASHQRKIEQLHLAFKKANGYSELEISQKRIALENVLIPDTIENHQQRLNDAGFDHSLVWMQCLNFVSILAIK